MTVRKVYPEEPSPHPWQRYDWWAIREQLMEEPGRWFKIFDWDRASLAVAIRIDGISALPSADFEITTRNNERGQPRMCTMYMRYNPGRYFS